jgi:hypothetical protein
MRLVRLYVGKQNTFSHTKPQKKLNANPKVLDGGTFLVNENPFVCEKRVPLGRPVDLQLTDRNVATL